MSLLKLKYKILSVQKLYEHKNPISEQNLIISAWTFMQERFISRGVLAILGRSCVSLLPVQIADWTSYKLIQDGPAILISSTSPSPIPSAESQ